MGWAGEGGLGCERFGWGAAARGPFGRCTSGAAVQANASSYLHKHPDALTLPRHPAPRCIRGTRLHNTLCSPPRCACCAAYYRGAQGIIFVYDVSRAETFESLGDIWCACERGGARQWVCRWRGEERAGTRGGRLPLNADSATTRAPTRALKRAPSRLLCCAAGCGRSTCMAPWKSA